MKIGVLASADKNNLIPPGEEASGLSIEGLTDTWTRFDFTFHADDGADGSSDITDLLTISAGLIPRAGTASPYTFSPGVQFTAVASTDVITSTAQFADGDEVRVSNTGGALPAPLVAATSYYVVNKSGATHKLAATRGGTAINLTTNGTGTNTISNCPIAVSWTRGYPVDGLGVYTGLFGTVTEKWISFGVEITAARRTDVDVGYVRPGPRYTLLLSGSEYRGYIDYIATGGKTPQCVVAGPIGGFDFPLRLAMDIAAPGAGFANAEIRDIVLGGRLGQKTILSSANKTAWGVDSAHLHLRIRQTGTVPGAPYDIDL